MAESKAPETTWTTVSTGEAEPETKIVFDSIGDEFVGVYLGMRVVDPQDITEKPYQQARFQGVGSDEGTVYFTNAGFSLRAGLRDVRKGSLVRLTWESELDTGQSSPMKVFRVEVGKLSRNT